MNDHLAVSNWPDRIHANIGTHINPGINNLFFKNKIQDSSPIFHQNFNQNTKPMNPVYSKTSMITLCGLYP